MADINIEEEFKKLKYNLPDFRKLDEEFEISNIQGLEDKRFLSRFIRRKVNEKVIFFCRIIESILYPQSPNYISMVESRIFTEEEKQEISELYKRLMHYEKESLILDIESDDKASARYINEVFNSWPEIKKEMVVITKKMQKAWNEKEKIESYTF
ncbi:hypothetical protein HY500_02310 [Candidatus Woesearchaeota archaeon]|nr:hypothetical protein [Candidatus Woesearchaeota archaeon]